MPMSSQIIPEYLVPHVETYINDNTIFQETTATNDDVVRSLFIFTSGKGRDNVILPYTNTASLIEEFGKPNYKLYGQALYNAYAGLSSGYLKAWCMRVMPDNASYSNAVVIAKAKVVGTGSTATIDLHFETVSISNLTSKSTFSSSVEALSVLDPDEEGFVTIPLFGVYVLGKGEYGNSIRFRILPSPIADADNGYKNFIISVLSTEDGISTIESAKTGSFYPDALSSSNKSLFVQDIINDSETGSSKIGMYVSEAGFSAIYDLYKSVVTDTTLTLDVFDPITALTVSRTEIPKLSILNTITGAVALDRPEGVIMAGGDDGSFKTSNLSREDAINTALIKAFSGELDSSILSKRRVPCEFILDANYEESVKRAMAALIVKRKDAYGFIDAGILNTVSDAISWGESFASLGSFFFSKDCNSYSIRDSFTGKTIPVTSTYFFASSLPVLFKSTGLGNQIPFVGESRAKLSGYIKGSVKPIIDADDLTNKEKLYNLRVNFFECIAEDTYIRSTQTTSQNVWSDLSEENNVHVLLELKRIIENFVSTKNYNFAEAEDRAKFTKDAERLLTPFIGNKIRSGSVKFEMNSFEEERSILHCYLNITYKTMAKRGIIEIDINKRT